VQQRAVVARTLLAGVAQRLIALRPFLVRAAAEVSDSHALPNGSRGRRFLSVTRVTSGGGSVYVLCCSDLGASILLPPLSGKLQQYFLDRDMSKHKISTTADGGRKSGRAVFDNQGRASWEWQTATGVFQTDVTNEQLQGLEAAGLAVIESEPVTTSGRVWASPPVRRAVTVAPARDQTVLKRILRRLSG
jgi:hypothetical protein